jgi:hypothetical protein
MPNHERIKIENKQRRFDSLGDYLDYEEKKKLSMNLIKDNDELISAYDYGYEDAIADLFDLANLVYLADKQSNHNNASLQSASLNVLYDAIKRRPFESIYDVLKNRGSLLWYEKMPSNSDYKYPFKPKAIKYNLKQP